MITITNITPAKNSTNVSVNQDLEIRVSADFKLDPRNVSFKLNDIDIIPNVFSIYHGATDHELVITLYTRKRIKYGSTYRYGQTNLHYGMRDIFPSVLNYASRYVCQFTVWGMNDLSVEEKFVDSFVFSTEEGVFYNSNPTKYFYSDLTQSMANKLPEWSKARSDKYSNFQQLLNPLGEVLEKNQDLLNKIYQANAIQTVDLKELPFLYKYELNKDFEFQNFFNQDGSTFYVQPDISGIQGITRFDLFTDEENNLKSLYYNKTPTRLDTEQLYVNDNVLVYETIGKETRIDLDASLAREGTLVLYCTGVQSSISQGYDKVQKILKCRLYGTSLFNDSQEEDVVIYNERFLYSKRMWKHINGIEFFNLNGQEIVFKILHFPLPQYSSSDTKKMILPDGSSDRIIWSMDNRNNQTILQKNKTIGNDAIDVLRFAGATELVAEFGMKDIDNTTLLELKDLTVDYNSNYIYAIDNTFLYIFDKREPYPTKLKKIIGDKQDADFVLGLETDDLYLDSNGEKEISLKCIHRLPGKKIVKYRIKITKPDNSVEYLLRNGITNDPNNSSIFVKQDFLLLADIHHTYALTQSGEYLFELETMYQGGSVSKDTVFYYMKDIKAIAKYKLARILNDSQPVSIFIDTDNEVKIFTNRSVLHTIVFHKDGIIIDYFNKIIYSYEEYASLDVQ